MSKNPHNSKIYYYTHIFQVTKHRTLPNIYIYGSDEPNITQYSNKFALRGVKIMKYLIKKIYTLKMSKNLHN